MIELLTALGSGVFNTPHVELAGAKRVVVDGGAGQIHGLWKGPEIHVGGWKAVVAARQAKQPEPNIDQAKAAEYFAKLKPDDEFISNFFEFQLDPRSVGEVAKVLRAARSRKLKGVGHYGFPNWRYNMPVTRWQAENDAAMKVWKPCLTMVNPMVYVPDEFVATGVRILPLAFIYQTLGLLAEATRLAGSTEEVVPVISDRTVSGGSAATSILVDQILRLITSFGVKRVVYWSDRYEPATGMAVLNVMDDLKEEISAET